MFLISGEAEAVPGQEEVGPVCGGDPSHEQVVRYHDQEKVAQVNQHGHGGESGDWSRGHVRDWSLLEESCVVH